MEIDPAWPMCKPDTVLPQSKWLIYLYKFAKQKKKAYAPSHLKFGGCADVSAS